MSSNKDHLADQLRSICQVDLDRAIELLEAGSGSLERAIGIHFSQKRHQRATVAAVSATTAATTNRIKTKLRKTPVAESPSTTRKRPRGNNNEQTTTTQPTKTTNNKNESFARGGQQQRTLHSFLGLKEAPKQRSITSFFEPNKKNEYTSAARQAQCGIKQEEEEEEEENMTLSGSQEMTTQLISVEEEEPLATRHTATSSTGEEPEQEKADDKPTATHAPSPDNSPTSSSTTATPKTDPRLQYSVLAVAFTEMTSTTKRNAKLLILKTVLLGIIKAVGGVGGDMKSRKEDGRMLTIALELVSGKLSLGKANDSVSPVPLQVSGAAVSTAVATVTGVSKKSLRSNYRDTGDLGDTAAHFFHPGQSVQQFFVARSNTPIKEETDTKSSVRGADIVKIHGLLRQIATVSPGTGSQRDRQQLLVKLLRLSTSKEEIRFLVRLLLGNMRLGATMTSILAALAMAIVEAKEGIPTVPQEPAIQQVQKTFDICPKLNKVALALICGGVDKMKHECTVQDGCPIQPMLANPAHSLEEVEKLMTKTAAASSNEGFDVYNAAVAEWKYDGMRCQAHYDGTKVTLFSRHLHDNTAQFPDAAQFLLEARIGEPVKSFIIDAEIVGVVDVIEEKIRTSSKGLRATQSSRREVSDQATIKRRTQRLLPFQVLSTRRGAKGTGDGKFVQIQVFAFDLMYLNGESLLDKSLWERQGLLRRHFHTTSGFTFASSLELQKFDEDRITSYLQEAVEGGAEGLMVKLTGADVAETADGSNNASMPRPLPCPYESGTRSQTWLKVKRDYVASFADTIDVVPIGAWYGNGRKAEKGFLSPILFAIYDEDDGVFRSISRCMSFTDNMYKAIREFYFNGTPYPEGVGLGVDANDSDETKAEDLKVESCDSEDDGTQLQRKKISMADSDIESDNDDTKCGVHCFPSRPPSSVYVTNENPSIWFKPMEVWEVSFADLTLSRTHTAAAGLVEDPDDRGVALRFPRFKRRRPDKGIEQATNSVQIAQLFNQQYKQS